MNRTLVRWLTTINVFQKPGPIKTLLLVFVALDIFDVSGRSAAPATLISFACNAFPYTKLVSFMFPDGMLDFIQSNCRIGVAEPTVSMIFFMLKMSIAVMFIVPLVVFICCYPQHFLSVRETYFDKFRKPNGVKKEIQMFLSLVTINALICAGGVHMIAYSRYPERFVTLPMHKFIEDGTAMLAFIVVMFVPLFLSFLGSYLLMSKGQKAT